MTDKRQCEVDIKFAQVDKSITEEDFYLWVDSQPDKNEIYIYFNLMVEAFRERGNYRYE